MLADDNELFLRFEKLYWQLSRDMSFIWKEIFDQYFPGSQSHIMTILERSGPKMMSELADSMHLTRGAVTIASDKLIDQGYIDRFRDEKDRRVVYLSITDKGLEKMKELRSEGKKAMKVVFHDLSEEDLRHLVTVFEHALNNGNKLGKELDA